MTSLLDCQTIYCMWLFTDSCFVCNNFLHPFCWQSWRLHQIDQQLLALLSLEPLSVHTIHALL